MFGPRVLVAPITANCTADGLSCTSRHVYLPPLPGGEVWTNVFTNKSVAGGSNAGAGGDYLGCPMEETPSRVASVMHLCGVLQ